MQNTALCLSPTEEMLSSTSEWRFFNYAYKGIFLKTAYSGSKVKKLDNY